MVRCADQKFKKFNDETNYLALRLVFSAFFFKSNRLIAVHTLAHKE